MDGDVAYCNEIVAGTKKKIVILITPRLSGVSVKAQQITCCLVGSNMVKQFVCLSIV